MHTVAVPVYGTVFRCRITFVSDTTTDAEIGLMPTATRSTAGNLYLEVGATAVQALKSCTPPALVGQVVIDRSAPSDPVAKKHIGMVGNSPATAGFGLGMGKPMYEWIRTSFASGSTTQSGRFVTTSADNKVRSVLTFSDAVLTSVTFPALDATSRAAGTLTVVFDIGDALDQTGDGTIYAVPGAGKQKAWLVSNFRVTLPGLPCNRVTSVDALTWRVSGARDDIGQPRVPVIREPEVTVPDVTLTIGLADHDAWHTAAKAWFIDGKRTDAHEIDGSIELLSADLRTVVATIGLNRVGFKRFERRGLAPTTGTASFFKVELYVEQLSFTMP